jgi:FAD/FMN-containing dehydrogenase
MEWCTKIGGEYYGPIVRKIDARKEFRYFRGHGYVVFDLEDKRMNHTKKALQNVRGCVYTDLATLYCYSTDASIYQVMPAAVVCPSDAKDVSECVKAAKELGISVTARAAGTNLAGSCLGRGIVLDISKNMNRILGTRENGGEFFVDVEPGVVIDDLQAYLGERGLFFPSDPSSSEICMIGGNIGTKASGAKSVMIT